MDPGGPTLTLMRDSGPAQSADGTFGTLVVPGRPPLQTMEDDWAGNARGKSCIPPGDYRLQRSWFYRHGFEVFEVMAVPGRSRILIHPGNTEEDVEGCIAPGMRRDWLRVHDEDLFCPLAASGRKDECALPEHWRRKQAVVSSREAFHLFMQWMSAYSEAMLQVRWIPGLP
jgi:hypothetical protein